MIDKIKDYLNEYHEGPLHAQIVDETMFQIMCYCDQYMSLRRAHHFSVSNAFITAIKDCVRDIKDNA